MANYELKRVDFYQNYGHIEPDDLLTGQEVFAQNVNITTKGDYARGTLLMSDSNGYFIPATKEGVKSADEICILADDNFSLEEDEYTRAAAYFSGGFRGAKIILPWENEETNHLEEVSAIQSTLRKHQIYLF